MDNVSFYAIGTMAVVCLALFLYIKFVVNKPKVYKPLTKEQRAASKRAAKYGVKQHQNKLDHQDEYETDDDL